MQKLKNNFIVIPVPKDATNFEIVMLERAYVFFNTEDRVDKVSTGESTLKKYLIIGLITKDSCDFDCSEYVEYIGKVNKFMCTEPYYKDYKSLLQESGFNNEFDSFKSMIEAETSYLFENPLGKIPKKAAILIGGIRFTEGKESYAEKVNKVRYKNWQEAQDRVIEKLLILKQI